MKIIEEDEVKDRRKKQVLVGDDGKSLSSKRNRGEISESEYRDAIARSNGFKDRNEHRNEQTRKKGYESQVEYNNEQLKNKGYENDAEYRDDLAKNKGYKDRNDYHRKIRSEKGFGTGLPVCENNECPQYLGIYIGENKELLNKIINIDKCMPNSNPGYDAICAKDKKVDVKCACLSKNSYVFHTRKNKISDYFLCIAFDNRENLKVKHIWLMKGNTVIEKTNAYQSREFIVNERDAITIGKGNKSLKRWIKHEIVDNYKLEEVQKVCNIFKDKYKGRYEI